MGWEVISFRNRQVYISAYPGVGAAFSAEVELLKVVVTDLAAVAFVTCSHDIIDVLIGHWVVKVIGEGSLEITGPEGSRGRSLRGVESLVCFCTLGYGSAALVPAQVDHFLQKVEVIA